MDFSFLTADSQQRPVGARDLEGCKGVWFELQICNGALGQVRRIEIELDDRAALHIVEDARFMWTNYEITELDMANSDVCCGDFGGCTRR